MSEPIKAVILGRTHRRVNVQAILAAQSDGSVATFAISGWLIGLLLFFLFFLFAVNWQRLWPILREGGVIPLTLLLVLVALVWSQVAPENVSLFGVASIGNFWWQVVVVGLVSSLACLAGWLQERYSWFPPEIALEPQGAHGHDHHSQHHEGASISAHGDSHEAVGHGH